MTGEELYWQFVEVGRNAKPGSEEWGYCQILMTAWVVVGPDQLFAAIETAQRTGKRIGLIEPPKGVYGEPNGIELV